METSAFAALTVGEFVLQLVGSWNVTLACTVMLINPYLQLFIMELLFSTCAPTHIQV